MSYILACFTDSHLSPTPGMVQGFPGVAVKSLRAVDIPLEVGERTWRVGLATRVRTRKRGLQVLQALQAN
jgi:hypothetical protein